MDYKTKDGLLIRSYLNDGNTEKIKLNLPLTIDDYLSGNGEGVWCEIDSEQEAKAINHPPTLIPVKILNDSVFYPNLKYGDLVLAEFRNSKTRPVADRDELIYHYGQPISEQEKQEIIKKIYEHHCRGCIFKNI